MILLFWRANPRIAPPGPPSDRVGFNVPQDQEPLTRAAAEAILLGRLTSGMPIGFDVPTDRLTDPRTAKTMTDVSRQSGVKK